MPFLQSVRRTTIKAVGADLALRQAYGLYYGVNLAEFQRVEVQTLCYLCHHSLVFGRVCGGIRLQSLFGYVGVLYLVGLIEAGGVA